MHDKDEREVWSDMEKALVAEPKPDQLHAVIKFASRAKSALLERLAFGIGIEPQYVEKPGRGRYAFDNMLSYLTHVKYADKHKYAPSEVATVRGPDYLGIDAQRRETWLKGRAHVKKKFVAENVEDMRERVLQGEITRDQIMLTDELFDIYSRHQREIEAAGADHGSAVDLIALQRRVHEDREYREQAERGREHARRVRAESRRKAFEPRVAELDRGGSEESRGYGLSD